MVYRIGNFSFQLENIIRGHHIYKSVWTPFTEETLSLTPDGGNELNRYAVGVVTDGAIVGHAPIVFFRLFIFFVRHDGYITAEVMIESTRIISKMCQIVINKMTSI